MPDPASPREQEFEEDGIAFFSMAYVDGESTRLDLLKMHAGSDASRQIATSIEAAQELKRGLEIALSAK